MFFLKFLFILLLIAFIILLAYTIYHKITHPEKSFMDCIPFMGDFKQSANEPDSNAEAAPAQSQALKTNSVADAVSNKELDASTSKADETDIQNLAASTAVKKADSKKAPTKAAKPKAAAKSAAKKTTTKTTKKPAAKKAKATKAKGDNIKKVNGIGPVFEKKLNAAGINTFEQIAAWSNADIIKIDEQLELSGRPQREEWVAKAKVLAAAKNA